VRERERESMCVCRRKGTCVNVCFSGEHVCVCVCVCVCEREREREYFVGEHACMRVYVCVCTCERRREHERESVCACACVPKVSHLFVYLFQTKRLR